MGHTFKFEVIPLTEAVEETVFPHSADEKPVVMVVDDEPLIVDSLAAILRTAGLTVLKAYSGASALELAMTRSPHLLVTDVAMPGMNGIDLAMAVAEALPGCKVLLFSAHASSLDLMEARAAGFDFPLLAKPIHPREMLRRITECLPSQSETKELRSYTDRSSMPWPMPQVMSESAS